MFCDYICHLGFNLLEESKQHFKVDQQPNRSRTLDVTNKMYIGYGVEIWDFFPIFYISSSFIPSNLTSEHLGPIPTHSGTQYEEMYSEFHFGKQ